MLPACEVNCRLVVSPKTIGSPQEAQGKAQLPSQIPVRTRYTTSHSHPPSPRRSRPAAAPINRAVAACLEGSLGSQEKRDVPLQVVKR
ncbi:hypothetical protein C8J56DRAFT_1170893 [Mycena floridula]|nr:hypothetical protein C8J56DRAFT_1170893 [Mycena floridula]